MTTTIGTQEWIDRQIKTALDNRANQLNPQHPAYHAVREANHNNSRPDDNKFGIVATAALAGAAVTAFSIWAVNKIANIRAKNREEDSTVDIEGIELECDETDEEEL